MEKDYLIKKWLNNALTKEEQKAFNDMEDASLSTAIIENAPLFKASPFSTVATFDTLQNKIQLNKKTVRTITWKRSILKIASVLILGFAVYYLFFNNQLTQVQTLAAEKTTITLPDNSTVILNAVSKINYNEKKWEDARKLSLEGEAFFKVAKGKTFDVNTSEGKVSVLGTQFSVKQRFNYFEVICFEGSVQVTTANTVEQLLAGDIYRQDNGIQFKSATTENTPSWTDNLSTFKSVRFDRVLNELERQYALTVTYEGKKNERYFTGAFAQDNLDNALLAITTPLGLTYKIEDTGHVLVWDK